MEIEKIKTLLEPVFNKHDVVLYDMSWKKSNQDHVLEILIYKKDMPTDVDTCVNVSYDVSELLDEVSELDIPYLLDVSSAGIEREIKNDDQLRDVLYHHVHVKVDKPVDNMHVIEGKLTKIDDENIEVLYRKKHKEVAASILKSNIRKIRMAVKV